MENRVLVFTTAACMLACSTMYASAQQSPGSPMRTQPDQHQMQQPSTQEAPGMMGQSGMMGRGMMGHGDMQQGMMSSVMMRMIFSLMDGDGDGSISLQEFQAAHERIFRAMDSNKDGRLTMEEMQVFMHGSRPVPR
jgi:hypothetical protein